MATPTWEISSASDSLVKFKDITGQNDPIYLPKNSVLVANGRQSFTVKTNVKEYPSRTFLFSEISTPLHPNLESLLDELSTDPYFFSPGSGGGGGTNVDTGTADNQTLRWNDGATKWQVSATSFSTPPTVGTDILLTGSFDYGAGVAAGAAWGDGAGKAILNWIDIPNERGQMSYIDAGANITVIVRTDINGTLASFADGTNSIATTTGSNLGKTEFNDGASKVIYVRVTDKQARAEFADGTETASVTCEGSGVNIVSTTADVRRTAIVGRLVDQGTERKIHTYLTSNETTVLGQGTIVLGVGATAHALFAAPAGGDRIRVINRTGGNVDITSADGKTFEGVAGPYLLVDGEMAIFEYSDDLATWLVL